MNDLLTYPFKLSDAEMFSKLGEKLKYNEHISRALINCICTDEFMVLWWGLANPGYVPNLKSLA